ncbi:MAG TPA: ATP-binding cassette domain-containing protein [Marinospirillum sp.]|uniref:ATP-binding cassette domain-containing protein n=1 Tax=Marinospirillum sp. TaxID=2183934 RepID=UPI002B488BD7|nr:ATP-binding cassette domain-containing protein [Marinospirillum sp.]HKM15045.1 ATP-binding cassette domain-containing protein [Marinospirillum sp.]
MLKINHLELKLGEQTWQHHLQVEAGELVVIMGGSGSGKSTLLNAIAGFLPVASGSILVKGQAIQNLPPEERPVSYLFQQQNFFEHLSIETNLKLGFAKGKPSQAEWQQVLKACDLLEVTPLLKRLPSKLSGGQQQRLALIRSVLRPMPVVLLDEPFSALDDDLRQVAGKWLQGEIKSSGRVALLVTHRQADADALADQLLILEGG